MSEQSIEIPASSPTRWLMILPFIGVVLLGVILALNLHRDPKLVPSPLIGKPAPVFATVDLLTNAPISTETLRGQAYVLNVWASWCPVCQIEHRHFNNYAKIPGALPVVGLNYKDNATDAKRWLAKLGNPYRDIAVDADGRIGLDFGVYGAPETYFVDAQGVIRFKHVGEITPELLLRESQALGMPK